MFRQSIIILLTQHLPKAQLLVGPPGSRWILGFGRGGGGKTSGTFRTPSRMKRMPLYRVREYSCENCPKRKYRKSIDQRLGNVSINHHTRSIMVVTSVKGRVQPAWASHLRAFGAESTHDAWAAKIRATRKPPRPPRPGNVCLTVVLHTRPKGEIHSLVGGTEYIWSHAIYFDRTACL